MLLPGGSPSEFNKLVNTKIVDIATQEIKDISAYSTDGRLIDEKIPNQEI